MNLITLGSNNQPVDEVEGYNSLIWTERYRANGDFTLTTNKIDEIRTKLPLESFVSLQDSKEVMMVESHAIDADEDGPDVLTVTGRTIETFLENRAVVLDNSPLSSGGGGDDSVLYLTPATTASAAEDFDNFGYNVNVRDTLDPYQIVDVTTKSLTATQRQVARTDTYSELIKMLAEDNLGIRNVRTTYDSPDFSITPSRIYGEVYNGTDKTSTVILDARVGHFGKGKYLWSVRNYKNVVYVANASVFTEVQATGVSALLAFQRRTGVLNLSDVTQTGTTATNILKARGRAYLAENKKTVVFEAPVSPNIPYKYKVDYDLGDTIKVIGNYGLNQNLMVTEHVRIEDNAGERSYPSLADPSEV